LKSIAVAQIFRMNLAQFLRQLRKPTNPLLVVGMLGEGQWRFILISEYLSF
jgi:hypothetical protein